MGSSTVVEELFAPKEPPKVNLVERSARDREAVVMEAFNSVYPYLEFIPFDSIDAVRSSITTGTLNRNVEWGKLKKVLPVGATTPASLLHYQCETSGQHFKEFNLNGWYETECYRELYILPNAKMIELSSICRPELARDPRAGPGYWKLASVSIERKAVVVSIGRLKELLEPPRLGACLARELVQSFMQLALRLEDVRKRELWSAARLHKTLQDALDRIEIR